MIRAIFAYENGDFGEITRSTKVDILLELIQMSFAGKLVSIAFVNMLEEKQEPKIKGLPHIQALFDALHRYNIGRTNVFKSSQLKIVDKQFKDDLIKLGIADKFDWEV